MNQNPTSMSPSLLKICYQFGLTNLSLARVHEYTKMYNKKNRWEDLPSWRIVYFFYLIGLTNLSFEDVLNFKAMRIGANVPKDFPDSIKERKKELVDFAERAIREREYLYNDALITLKDIEKVYATDHVETTALNNVNLQIRTGEFVAIMGPSGCGKSTLLNIIGMLDNPTTGSYEFENWEVAKLSEKHRSVFRKGKIGFIFQSFNLIDELTVFENVALPLNYLGISDAEAKTRTEEVLERMNIMHRRNHFPAQLSGGQQQRVAIARALVGKPRLILADEPTGNLDSANGEEVMKLLSQLNEEGTTIVMVTHSPYDANYASRIINLFDGKVVTEYRRDPVYS